jgi:hypothetical protein
VQTAFRDGLIIALLALIPLRRRTLEVLRIGTQLVRSCDQLVLDIRAEDVKTKRPLDYPLSPELLRRIDIYINKIRSKTAGADTHDYLWASSRGRPLKGQVIYNAVRRRTRKAFGFAINLHRFRRAAGTFWSIHDPVNVRGVKDLLGHASFATTEKYYIMAQSRLGGAGSGASHSGLENRRAPSLGAAARRQKACAAARGADRNVVAGRFMGKSQDVAKSAIRSMALSGRPLRQQIPSRRRSAAAFGPVMLTSQQTQSDSLPTYRLDGSAALDVGGVRGVDGGGSSCSRKRRPSVRIREVQKPLSFRRAR